MPKRPVSHTMTTAMGYYGRPSASKRRRRTVRRKRVAANSRTGGFVDVENKFLDSELTSTALDAAGAMLNPTGTGCTNSLTVPAQGDGESERDGRVYYINSIHIRGNIIVPPTESGAAPDTDSYCRVILYWDTQTNAAEAAFSDVIDTGGTSNFLGFRNLQNSKRFIVLKDKIIRLRPTQLNEGAANLFATAGLMVPFTMNKKFSKGIKVRCVGTTANVSSCSDNNMGLGAIVSDATLAPTIAYQCRVRFSG